MSQLRSISNPRYRTTNWASYNAALKSRGSLSIWFDPRMQWFAAASGKSGRSPKFSDAAIQFCLTIKNLFVQTFRPKDVESVEWLPPAQFGGDQDGLHQTTGRAGHVQNI